MTLARVPTETRTAHSHGGELVSEAEGQQVSFLDLVDLIWQGRRLVLATIAIVLVLAFVHMRIATPAYTASMIVMPVSSGAEGSSLASSALRSLSPLVGLDLSSSDPQVSAFDMFRQAITSARVANRLEEEHGVLRRVYASRWDEDARAWTAPGGVVGMLRVALNWLVGQPLWTPPSALTLSSYLRENLIVTKPDDQSPLLRLEFSNGDPAFAADFLRWVHQEADQIVKQDTWTRAQANIAYLRSQLLRTEIREHKSVLVELVLREEAKMMLMGSDLPYAAGVLEPVRVSDAPTSPNPLPRLVVALVVGLFLGTALVIGLAILRGFRRDIARRRQAVLDA